MRKYDSSTHSISEKPKRRDWTLDPTGKASSKLVDLLHSARAPEVKRYLPAMWKLGLRAAAKWGEVESDHD